MSKKPNRAKQFTTKQFTSNPAKQLIEYVWIDANDNLRSKTRVVDNNPQYLNNPDQIEDWNFDGSSTGQAIGEDSEVIIKPRRAIKCPFRRGDNLIVLCDCYDPNDQPIESNQRFLAKAIFDQGLSQKPWFGMEQEFFFREFRTNRIMGFDNNPLTNPKEQGQYYCSVGSSNAFGRNILEDALENFLYADLTVSGINGEVAPGQWEYQIGPVEGIDAGDQLYLSRYILSKTAEEYEISVDFDPKPMDGNWNGSGCHINFSVEEMRQPGGKAKIEAAIVKLSAKHTEHMAVYGKGNNRRLTGNHETAKYDEFTSGRADRGASVRIGNNVYKDDKGYFEDRRPASNVDPYQATSILFKTTCLD
jgi:glutamine synthetase